MKSFLRNIIFNGFSLFILAQVLAGFKVIDGLPTYIVGGVVLTLLLKIVRPILNVLALPLNLVTLGLFSFIINAIIFYLLTVLVIGINISAFTFNGISYAGFIVPKFYVGTISAFILASLIQTLTVSFMNWLTDNDK
jgi:putative membrane protein